MDLANKGPDGELNVAGIRTALAASKGQAKLMRELGARFRELATRMNLKDQAAGELGQQAVFEVLFGNNKEAVADAQESLKMSNAPNVILNAAGILAFTGHDKDALKLTDDISKRRPYDTGVQFVSIPMARAGVDLSHGQYAKVIDELDGAMVYGRTNIGVLYLRGLAYLKMGKGQRRRSDIPKAA